jgi:choline dehydrogenase-like flavoprotein
MRVGEAVDVLVVGAGAGGAAAAWRLATGGASVVCLEQGDWVPLASAPQLRADWEVARRRWRHPNPNVRRLAEDYPVNEAGTPIKPLMFNAVGGSTIHWGAHFPRLHPSDFRVRTLDGVADDWPLDYFELESYFELNDRMMGIAGRAGDPANPPREPRQMPPVPLGRGGELLAAAFDRLGWHWWPVDVAINTLPYGEGRGVCNYCGPCDLGCPIGARASADLTYWPAALAAGVELRTRSRVFEITVDAGGRATGASYIDADGQRVHQPAGAVVVAANGIGTPRLLLLSASSQHPEGLANSSGLVGKNLMFHPSAMVTGVFDEALEGFAGPFVASIYSQEFYETDPDRDFVRGYQMQLLRGDGPLGTALGGYLPPLPWGADHHEAFLDAFGHTVTLAVTTEDLPEEHNRVTLDPELKDSDGLAAPRVEYALDTNVRAILAHGVERASTVLGEAGAHKLVKTPLIEAAGFHLLGTARMGDDPASSVVDRWGRSHDVDNLYIVDGSVFVTGGAVNPTSTLQALALRSADHLLGSEPAISTPSVIDA